MTSNAAIENIAQLFHEAYERLAPQFGYKTRDASAVPWADVPENNRALMTATVAAILPSLVKDDGWCPVSDAPKDGSTVLFRIEMTARAYWDAELRDWVLNYPINMERVRNATGCALPDVLSSDERSRD